VLVVVPNCDRDRVLRPYFNQRMANRQRLLWAVATRRQLERWELLVASSVRADLGRGPAFEDAAIWHAAIEHHFVLIAAGNLVQALELGPPTNVTLDRVMRNEIVDGRNLLEHWVENMPVFNMDPRGRVPSGSQRFATRNPRHGPYDWLAWSNTSGAEVMPQLTAFELHDLLDAVEADVLAKDTTLGRFLEPRLPSPWVEDEFGWWPKPEEDVLD
jgi:hypothetical protein